MIADGAAESHSPELGRAHLYRLRGDLQAAIDQCLSVLRKDPEHHEAHVMLGDLHAEKGSLDQAAEWYELALDLRPDSAIDQAKLDDVRDRIRARDAEARIDSLGLPPERNGTPLLAGGLLALVAVIALIGWGLSRNRPQPKARLATSLVAPAPPMPTVERTESTIAPPPPVVPTPVPAASAGSTRAEQASLALLRQRSSEGARLLALATDPRARLQTLTFEVGPNDPVRTIAATLAKDALENDPSLQVVVVRGMRAGELVFVADVNRTRLAETGAAGWAEANGGPEAWIDHVLTNEFPARTTPASAAPAVEAPAPTVPASGVNGEAAVRPSRPRAPELPPRISGRGPATRS